MPTVIAVIIWLTSHTNDDNAEQAPTSATTSTTAPVATQLPTNTGPTTTTQPTSMAPKQQRALLSELPLVSGSNNIDLDFADVDIDGVRYTSSLHYHCSLYCDGKSPATYEVSLGGLYTLFQAKAGIASTGANEPTKFEIEADGEVTTVVASAGKAQDVSVDVRGVQRLKIRIYAPAPLVGPLQAGVDATSGDERVLPDAALGSPVLSR
ncbi:NPCBM/NEW2 domain-containing protein [Lentzea guizhouensis]|uniref:NPCBM/NEW2 domain-containing protein n=1 Tax=Lentzea guizhouensis TaxID=1586287 RepID=UPI0014746E27|nr:NPCBM/NEW2 domain-containing protein [Lentzea guizhouensis]